MSESHSDQPATAADTNLPSARPAEHASGPDLAAVPLAALLEMIGERTPTPGGGAVAALTAALAASVSRMVVHYSIGRKALAQFAELHDEALHTLQQLSDTAMNAAAADAAAFAELNALWKLPEDDPQRVAAWGPAVKAAIEAPMAVLSASLGILHVLRRLSDGATNRMLDSDLAIGAVLAAAAAHCSTWNIRINLQDLPDRSEADRIEHETASLMERARTLAAQIEAACNRPKST